MFSGDDAKKKRSTEVKAKGGGRVPERERIVERALRLERRERRCACRP